MLNWMRKRKLNKLAVKLAGVDGEIAEHKRIAEHSGKCFPMELVRLARDRAELALRIQHLESGTKSASA